MVWRWFSLSRYIYLDISFWSSHRLSHTISTLLALWFDLVVNCLFSIIISFIGVIHWFFLPSIPPVITDILNLFHFFLKIIYVLLV